MRNMITNHKFKNFKNFTVDRNRITVAKRCTVAFFENWHNSSLLPQEWEQF
jgi:hypothetical protein